MPRASHRIVGVVELEPSKNLVTLPATSRTVTLFHQVTHPRPTLLHPPKFGTDPETRQAIVADVDHLRNDLDREFNHYLATA